MRRDKKQQIALGIGIALTAGMFSIMPTASAAPVLDHVVTEGTKVDQTSTANVTDISSTVQNNVIDWKDFSVAHNETVKFDEHNYLNVVTGVNTSRIDGTLQGGNNVYIVNPNGVIFGNTAKVLDVGNLYVSTRPIDEAAYTFETVEEKQIIQTLDPLSGAATSTAGDIVNMGTINATSVSVEGNNIKFMDVDEVNAAVTIQASGNIRLGRDINSEVTTAVGGGYTTNKTSEIFTTISDKTGLQKINTTNLAGDYELKKDIKEVGSYTPIGNSSPFTGTFNGNFFTVSGIIVAGGNYGGLFGYTSGNAKISNVGVSGVSIKAVNAGGIVGKATENTQLTNVFNAGGDVSPSSNIGENRYKAGGIVGHAENTTINKAYNLSKAKGGIVGYAYGDLKITNAYNENTSVSSGILAAGDRPEGSAMVAVIQNAYTLGNINITSDIEDVSEINCITGADNKKSINDYTNWNISNSGSENTDWRIYEGQTRPLLRDLLRRGSGPVSVTYNYVHGDDKGSNDGADITPDKMIYNGSTVSVEQDENNNNKYMASLSWGDTNKLKYATGNKNIALQTIVYTDQLGYDLIGSNVTMGAKEISFGGAQLDFSHVYDGTTDVSAELKEVLESGNGVSGIVAGDNVKLTLGSGFSANFETKDASKDYKKIILNGTTTLAANSSTGENDIANYKLAADTKTMNKLEVYGKIAHRPIYMTINKSGITKIYDGTTAVDAAYAPNKMFTLDDTISAVGTGTSGKIAGDYVALATSKDSPAYYVDANKVETRNVNDAVQVKYENVSLTGDYDADKNFHDDSANYVLKYMDGEKEKTVTDSNVFLSGTITPKFISNTNFQVQTGDSVGAGTKVYDGTSDFALKDGETLIAGDYLVDWDKKDADGKAKLWITFGLDDTGSRFLTEGNEETKNAADAVKIAYKVKASTLDAINHPLSNYKIGDSESSAAVLTTDSVDATGAGEIQRRAIEVELKKATGIDKPYDQSDDVIGDDYITMGGQYVDYTTDTAYKLVKNDPNKSSSAVDNADIKITAKYLASADGKVLAKDVYRDADGTVKEKKVGFTIYIDGTDAKNYTLNGHDAESYSFTPEGTGTINPLVLTPTFNEITKTYNGTTKINDSDAKVKIGETLVTPTNENVGTVNGLSGDKVKLVYDLDKASFDNRNASTSSKMITYTDLKLEGDDKDNYELKGGTEATGKGYINKRAITKDDIEATFAEISKTYDGNTIIDEYEKKLTSLTVKNVTDDALAFKVNTGSFIDANRKGGADLQKDGVQYTISLTDEEQLNNYTLGEGVTGNSLTITTDGSIIRKDITPQLVNSVLTKTYDNSEKATNGNGTEITGDDLVKFVGMLSGTGTNETTAVYAGKDADDYTGKVTYSLKLTEADGVNNYRIVDSIDGNGQEISTLANRDGVINKRLLTIDFEDVSKDYNGSSAVAADDIEYTLGNNTIKADNVTLTLRADDSTDPDDIGLTGTYGLLNGNDFTADEHHGTKKVRYEDLNKALGAFSKNYKFEQDFAYGDGTINTATITMDDFVFDIKDFSRDYNATDKVGDDAKDHVTKHYIDLGMGANNPEFDFTVNLDKTVFTSVGDAIDGKGGKTIAGTGSGKDVKYVITITKPDLTDSDYNFANESDFVAEQTYSNTLTGKGTIKPKAVYASVNTNNAPLTKTYDATPDVKVKNAEGKEELATPNQLINIEGLLTEKDGSSNVSKAVYVDTLDGEGNVVDHAADHGKNKQVKYTVALDTTNADNYIIYDKANPTTVVTEFTTDNNVINQRDLKLTFADITKVYDGYNTYGKSTVVGGGQAYKFDGLQGTDSVTVAEGYTANAKYSNPNVENGVAKTVTYGKLTINGNEKSNYRLLDKDGAELTADVDGKYMTTGSGTISKYTLTSAPTITFNHVNKEYDGTDDVVYSRNSEENDPRKFINATIKNASNQDESLGFDLVNKPKYQGSYVNSNDGLKLRDNALQNTATFTLKFSSDNYDFSNDIADTNFKKLDDGSGYQYSAKYDNATITPRKITVTLGEVLSNSQNIFKTYDADADVEQNIRREYFNFGADDVLTKADGVTKDNVYLKYNDAEGDGIKAAYEDKNAGINKEVTYTLALDGTDAGNYVLTADSVKGEGIIDQAKLVINDNTFDPVEKQYDGNNTVNNLTSAKVHLTGVQKADGTNEVIGVDNAIYNGIGDSTNKIIGTYESANVKWKGDTDEEDFQGVTYSNLQNALKSMTADGVADISNNYIIVNEKVYSADKQKGKITAIPVTENATAVWTPVTREYNAGTDIEEVFDYTNNTVGAQIYKNDILKLTVKDKDGQDITIDYEATANFDKKDVSDKRVLQYAITQVDKKVKDKDGNRNYKLTDDVYKDLMGDDLQGKTFYSSDKGVYNKISKRQLSAIVKNSTDVTKVYDGSLNASTDNFVLDEDDVKVLEKDGYTINDVIQKTANYSNKNATISPGEANKNTLTISYELATTANADNYEVSTTGGTGIATGDITRRTLSLVADPVSVDVGASMPIFTGTVTGFAKDEETLPENADFISSVSSGFKVADGTTTSTPGNYGVYGWYMGDKTGLLGDNYIFAQAPANATAFTVNYVNNNTGNPDTKITPNNSIYHQISKDMNSGFGDNGAAAIEYKDKSGKVLGTENIDSGEINGKGLTIGGATDMSKQADGNANIGIAGGDIVNMEGANAAGSVNVETSGDGTVVNLEVFSIGGDKQSGDNNSAAKITNTADKTYSLGLDNSTEGEIAIKNTNDTIGTLNSIAITDGKQNILGEEAEDKKEEQEKEGTIAIKSSNGEDDDEIELTVEKQGVNVA